MAPGPRSIPQSRPPPGVSQLLRPSDSGRHFRYTETKPLYESAYEPFLMGRREKQNDTDFSGAQLTQSVRRYELLRPRLSIGMSEIPGAEKNGVLLCRR